MSVNLTGRGKQYDAALDSLDAADRASSDATETARLRRAQVEATLAQIDGRDAEDADRLDMAWRVLGEVGGSIGKADTKAAFVTTLNTAVLAGVFTLTHLDRIGTAARVFVTIGAVLLVIALMFAVAVVLPVLRARKTKHNSGSLLYFGTVRQLSTARLLARIASEDTVDAVCAQAVVLSRLSWLKHRLLQVSMLATIAGANLIVWPLLLGGGA
ncbi:Pycsar system effector family protein [Kribbella sp. NPDC003557]|uniref:Pycsar system effector family protein n=1 Tax=Kribbella sp. NPDC003557 TaxID=3154449 RepID=UPI0033B89767